MILHYRILSAQEIQVALRVLREVHKIGLKYSLESLLVDSKRIPEKTIESLMDKLQIKLKEQRDKQFVIKFDAPNKILVAKKSSQYQVLKLLFLLLLLHIVGIRYYLQRTNNASASVSGSFESASSKTMSSKTTSKTMSSKTMSKKINSSIKKKADTIKEWRENTNKRIKMALWMQRVALKKKRDKNFLLLRGKLKAPRLPQGTFWKMNVQFLYRKQKSITSPKNFTLDNNNFFQLELLLPAKLTPDFYLLNFTLPPDLQKRFLVQHFAMKRQKKWQFSCFLKGKKNVEKFYKRYIRDWHGIISDLQKMHVSFQNVIYEQKRSRKWLRILDRYKRTKRRVEYNLPRSYIPVFPEPNNMAKQIIVDIEYTQKFLSMWHKNKKNLPQSLLEKSLYGDIKLDRLQKVIINKQKQIKKILKKKRAIIVE